MSTSTQFDAIVKNMAAQNRTLFFRIRSVLAVALLFTSGAAMAQNVYRWVDDAGKVHYDATLPAEYANRPHQILRNGIVIKDVTDPTAPEPSAEEMAREAKKIDPEIAARERRMRGDRLLLLKYHSEQDILDSMEVEVANLDYDARLIEKARLSVLASLRGQIREAADRQRAGLEVDEEVQREVAALRVRIRQGIEARENLDAREAQIRAGFLSELERYRYLSEGGAEGGTIEEPDAGESGP